jgi:hypothetical protein
MIATMEDRGKLALEVYQKFFQNFETFNAGVGSQLAYLLGAILEGDIIDLNISFQEHRKMHNSLQSIFDSKHPVWMHINVEF